MRRGSSSVGRAAASQVAGREFDTRLPLHFLYGAIAGTVNVTIVPRDGSDAIEMSPPCALMMSRQIARPNPEPGDPSPLTKRSKTRGSRSAGMPRPLSVTSTVRVARSDDARALKVTRPPDGVLRN